MPTGILSRKSWGRQSQQKWGHLLDGSDGGLAVQRLEDSAAIEAVAVLVHQIRLDADAAATQRVQRHLCTQHGSIWGFKI